ncbi:MAG: type 11 methyltransferase [Acidobacteriales bacterium 59-55]|nr:class I SAM-dependent methyltransferase [Terriglobales bacterium]ODU55407.1 MAG: type 11 methyltransferase [Granulicella sp. SCN 62-9]OJV39927.1 MAG: type 11 methyltransferase [Acidobacteriales bacterium 59-55]
MRNLFGSDNTGNPKGSGGDRTPRHSSGWKELLKHLSTQESLRVLDIGPTSSTNINYITSLGHSIYMANLVEEAAKPEWTIPGKDGAPPTFDVDGFLAVNLNFSGRIFDVVILWDTVDYLPESLLAPVFSRIHQVLQPGGLMLAFFHATADRETSFNRYHLTDTDVIEMQRAGSYPLLNVFSNRKIENMLTEFSNYRFFLAKDSLREVIITR